MALLCFANRAPLGTLTSAQTYETTLPLANLNDRRLAKIARTTSQGSSTVTMTIRIDHGGSRTNRVFALLNFNRRTFDAAGSLSTQLVTYSWKASNVSIGGTDIGSGSYDQMDIGFVEAEANVIQPLPQAYTARYWEFVFSWNTGGPQYAQAGVFWLSDAIDLGGSDAVSRGVDQGWRLNHIDPSIVDFSRGGQVYTDERARRRKLTVQVSVQDADRFFGDFGGNPSFGNSLQEALVRNGASREVILIPRLPVGYANAAANVDGYKARQFINRTALYGLLQAEVGLDHQKGPYHMTTLVVMGAR